MKSMARTVFWYPGVDRDIEDLVRRCETCIQASPMPPAEVPISWPDTNQPWSRLHVDYAGPLEGQMILIVVDSSTRWIEAVPMKTASAETTVEALRVIFARFGLPRTLVSDNGPQFTSAVFKQFLQDNHVQHLTTAPYHPQSNGLAERAVRTVKEGIHKVLPGNLRTRLARFLFRYRRTPTKDGKCPSERLLGYRIRSRIDCCLPDHSHSRPSKSSSRPLFAGRTVWSRNFGVGHRWVPGVIRSSEGARMATVDTSQGEQRRHADQLRTRVPSPTGQPATGLTPATRSSAVDDQGTTSPVPILRRSTRQRRPPERLDL